MSNALAEEVLRTAFQALAAGEFGHGSLANLQARVAAWSRPKRTLTYALLSRRMYRLARKRLGVLASVIVAHEIATGVAWNHGLLGARA